jgi:hypothetical protein
MVFCSEFTYIQRKFSDMTDQATIFEADLCNFPLFLFITISSIES